MKPKTVLSAMQSALKSFAAENPSNVQTVKVVVSDKAQLKTFQKLIPPTGTHNYY